MPMPGALPIANALRSGAPAGGSLVAQLQARQAAMHPQAGGTAATSTRPPPTGAPMQQPAYQGYSTNALNPAYQNQQAMQSAVQAMYGSGMPQQGQAGMSMGGADPWAQSRALAAQQNPTQMANQYMNNMRAQNDAQNAMAAYGGGPAAQGQMDQMKYQQSLMGGMPQQGQAGAAQGQMASQYQNQLDQRNAMMGQQAQAAGNWGQPNYGQMGQVAGQMQGAMGQAQNAYGGMGNSLQSGLGSLGGAMMGSGGGLGGGMSGGYMPQQKPV